MKAKGCSKKEEGEWEQENRGSGRLSEMRLGKEVKKEKAHYVISDAYHHLKGHPKKARGSCIRLFTNTIGGFAWR